MPISNFVAEKWDRKLYNWLLWAGERADTASAEGASISSIYDPAKWRRGSYRFSGDPVLSGEAMDTDGLMREIQRQDHKIYEALVVWTINQGTRGDQAQRCSCHRDTLRDRVDSGKAWLERIEKRRRHSKSTTFVPQTG